MSTVLRFQNPGEINFQRGFFTVIFILKTSVRELVLIPFRSMSKDYRIICGQAQPY